MNHAIIAERMVQTMVLDNVTVRTKTFTQYNSPNCSIVLFWVFFYFELSKKKNLENERFENLHPKVLLECFTCNSCLLIYYYTVVYNEVSLYFTCILCSEFGPLHTVNTKTCI